MNYTALEDELRNDPQNMGYQTHIDAGDHVTLAELIGQDDPAGATFYEPISSGKASRIAASNEAYANIESARGAGNAAVKSQAYAAWHTFMKSEAQFSLDKAGVRAMLQNLVDEGILTTTQRDDFLNVSQRTARREEAVLGKGTTVHHSDVTKALG